MAKVTIEIPDSLVRIIKSPMYYVICALTGVSVTFAPLFLFMIGQWSEVIREQLKWPIIVSCFLIVYFVPMFYMKVASAVISEVKK